MGNRPETQYSLESLLLNRLLEALILERLLVLESGNFDRNESFFGVLVYNGYCSS